MTDSWGNYPALAFLYGNGTITSLPERSFTGSFGCEAGAINSNGQLAGICLDTNGYGHLVLWGNGTVTDLGGFLATAINDNGQIVANRPEPRPVLTPS